MLLGTQSYTFTPTGTRYQDYTFGPVTASAASQTVSFMAVPQSASTAATVMLDNVRVAGQHIHEMDAFFPQGQPQHLHHQVNDGQWVAAAAGRAVHPQDFAP